MCVRSSSSCDWKEKQKKSTKAGKTIGSYYNTGKREPLIPSTTLAKSGPKVSLWGLKLWTMLLIPYVSHPYLKRRKVCIMPVLHGKANKKISSRSPLEWDLDLDLKNYPLNHTRFLFWGSKEDTDFRRNRKVFLGLPASVKCVFVGAFFSSSLFFTSKSLVSS